METRPSGKVWMICFNSINRFKEIFKLYCSTHTLGFTALSRSSFAQNHLGFWEITGLAEISLSEHTSLDLTTRVLDQWPLGLFGLILSALLWSQPEPSVKMHAVPLPPISCKATVGPHWEIRDLKLYGVCNHKDQAWCQVPQVQIPDSRSSSYGSWVEPVTVFLCISNFNSKTGTIITIFMGLLSGLLWDRVSQNVLKATQYYILHICIAVMVSESECD